MRRQRGFTIVELMVTMAVGAILVVAAVGMYLTVLGQSPIVKTRNTMSTNLQNALNRINDDVRRSSNVSTYNLAADPNAPTAKTGYTNVPGPDPDTNDQYYWRMGENRLIINQTPLDTSGNPIYDNVQYAAGKKNTLVYYVRNGALYRRVIAAAYGTNAVSTATCARVAEGGCVSSDIKLVDNLKASLGDGAFRVVYYDRNGNPISYTSKDAGGADVPDYTGFPLARSIGVTIQLESGEIIGTQRVAISNTMRMQFRSQLNVVPTVTVEPYVPPTTGIGEPGLIVGPGGLIVQNAKIQGGDAYVKGKVTVGFNAQMGAISWFWGIIGSPINLNVANVGCGTGSSFPQPCGAASQPITASAAFAQIGGTVCAKDQVDATNINAAGGGRGLIAGCVPPDADPPTFDKAAFTNSLSGATALGSAASCYNGSATLGGNLTYTTNISMAFYCKVTITGNAYVTANLSTSTYAELRVAESVGKVRPIIVVNGKIDMNSTRVVPNSYGTTPYFISFYSADSACSNSASCTTITSAKLKETLDNYSGSNSPMNLYYVNASGASFYAYFGEGNLDFYSAIGAIAAQRVRVQNASTMLMNGAL